MLHYNRYSLFTVTLIELGNQTSNEGFLNKRESRATKHTAYMYFAVKKRIQLWRYVPYQSWNGNGHERCSQHNERDFVEIMRENALKTPKNERI